jgi:hypothetical protein
MIFREYPALFFHIPKTAGVSVELWLGGEYPADLLALDYERLFGWDANSGYPLQYATPDIIRDIIGAELFERCYRFTVVRNPYARAVFSYHYQYDDFAPQFGSFEQYVLRLPELIRQRPGCKNAHFHPQVRYTQLDGAPCCHDIARFEDLPDSLKPVAKRLGVSLPLPFANVYRHPSRGYRPVSSFYTPETARALAEVYAEDFEAFGYSTELEAANESKG